ncbi:DUF4376 domain-containing protein [Sulfitobacter sp. OXR-159]|uniref:DUF4376 domain-containing protein n=1 Tax=Sulfitobacter sp. OXR-159 TaxID=3100174 RepID=UPI002AC90294|nr:DUF4376 domain-containing protein [Sulfitobacter sp. OXR-159]WPZ28980.1 DUF4376 domain-containing protein [Sulfitobacter sp. OXR-159]
MYAEVKDGVVVRVGQRPKWFYDDGTPVTDETLAEHGRLPVISNPQHDPATEVALDRDPSEWTVEADHVLVTFDVSAKPSPSHRDVNRERDRRLERGALVAIDGYGSIPVQGRPADQINMIALGDTARELLAAGHTAAVIPFRDADNVMHSLTPAQVLEMVRKGKEAAAEIYAVSWDMKDGTGEFPDGIPSDYTDDKHWSD